MVLKPGQLQARVQVTANLIARSGLRIGGALPGLAIGGIDLPVIRHPLTGYPYVPGSSLRGKMRALLDRWHGNEPNYQIGSVRIHMPKNMDEYNASPVGRLFGVLPGPELPDIRPTRLLVRDVQLDDREAARLRGMARGGTLYTEAKTEAAIDRRTSAAVPRTVERVLAGACFSGFTAVVALYDNDDVYDYLPLLLQGMRLLEDDYLGGHGSRGSGEVEFRDIEVNVRLPEDYSFPFRHGEAVARGEDLFDVALNHDDLMPRVVKKIQAS